MKKLKFLGLIAIILLLVACNGGDESVTGDGLETPGSEVPLGGVDPADDENGAVLESLAYLVLGSTSDYVALIDALTGHSLATFEREDGQWIWDIFNFDNGYFGLLVGDAELSEDGLGLDIPDDERLRYLILDQNLTVIDELLITNEDLQDWSTRHSSYVSYEAGQLVVYYVFDWMQAIWAGDDQRQSIRKYDVHTGETEVLVETDDEALFLSKIWRLTSGKIAFTGNRLNDEVNIYYGFIDLATGAVTTFYQSGFRFTDKVSLANERFLLNEDFSAPTVGVGMLSVDLGVVLVVDAQTGRNYVVQLNGMESVWARLSLDGNYIVTIDETGNYFRKYEIPNGNLIYEVRLDTEARPGSWLEIIPIADVGYAVYSIDENGNHQSVIVEVR